MQGDGCAERAEFERHTVFVRETSRDFREGLEHDESDGVGVNSFCLTEDIKYHMMNETSARKI